jgi:ParB family chromosome partitioning protein
VAKRSGLPDSIGMRHDAHYVETLTGPAGTPIGRLVPIDQIDPNPDQPRQTMGDLSELMASIAEKGILEPLIVRARSGRFQIIAGERRYQAAVQVGLRELPVVLREVDDVEIVELALVENLQRKDLTAFEEAEAMYSLADRCGYTHEDLAKKLGKARTSITESLALHKMPDDVKNLCRLADISSKSLLLEIVRQSDPQKMASLIERITRGGHATREQVRSATAKPRRGRPRAFIYKYRPPTKAFDLRLTFARSRVNRDEIITALQGIIRELQDNQASRRSAPDDQG